MKLLTTQHTTIKHLYYSYNRYNIMKEIHEAVFISRFSTLYRESYDADWLQAL